MLSKPKLLVTTGLLIGAIVGCDRAPTEPPIAEIEALLAAGAPASGSFATSNTLPALFREAVATVEKAEGRRGVETLLADWQSLHEQLKDEAPTAPRSAIEARLAAIRSEELRVVRQVLGDAVVTRVLTDVNINLAEARSQMTRAAASGSDITAATSMVGQIRENLSGARGALLVRDIHEALDHATEAAAQMAGLRYHLVELRRVAGLETLVPRAVETLKREPDARARSALARLEAVETQARAALRSGDRQQAHASLARVRTEQIRIVQRVYGSGEAERLVKQVAARAVEMRTTLADLDAAGIDIVKHQRMLRQAVDLNKRAAMSLATGDSGSAFDLGSHAAGLLNALQHLTWR